MKTSQLLREAQGSAFLLPIKISLASPEKIRSGQWRSQKPETINYRTSSRRGTGSSVRDLRPGKGLRVQLRQVQAHGSTVGSCAKVRRRGHPEQGAGVSASGTSRSRLRRTHLVLKPAEPHRRGPRHLAEGAREGPLLRVLRRDRPQGDAAEAWRDPDRKPLRAMDEYGRGFLPALAASRPQHAQGCRRAHAREQLRTTCATRRARRRRRSTKRLSVESSRRRQPSE